MTCRMRWMLSRTGAWRCAPKECLSPSGARMDKESLNRPLRVADLLLTHKDDVDRGPMVIMSAADARARLLTDGELAWVYGPNRHELATVRINTTTREGDVVLRDVF